jgi:predicted transcriptional regulator
VTDDDHLMALDRYEWERVVRRCVLPTTVKTVAAYAAQYANKNGTRIYPGVARLCAVTGLSERSVRAALTTLRELQLITRTRKGSSLGRQALTDEYKLTRPADLVDRVHMLDVAETPASAACDSTCGHPRSPAPPAGDKAPKRAPKTSEHRHVTTGTPAPGAGTPAPDDRITGTSCTPPMEDPLTYPLNDQTSRSDLDVSTEIGSNLLAELIRIDELAARRAASQ